MTQPPPDPTGAEAPATADQLAQLRSLAGDHDDIPEGMLASEAAQRIVELKSAGD